MKYTRVAALSLVLMAGVFVSFHNIALAQTSGGSLGGSAPSGSLGGNQSPSDNTTGGSGKLENPLKVSSLPELMTAILDGVVQIGAIT